jgi:hypothetical protein
MKTRIQTDRYTFATGHSPRGMGNWAFHPDFNVDACSTEIFWFNANFRDAKRAAQLHFKGRATEVHVLS